MWNFGRKRVSRFSASSTAEQVTQGIDGTGLTAIVTGASSGIGAETARVLALRGVHVIMAGIALDDSRKVKESILKDTPNATIDVMLLDLSSMASARSFAWEYISKGLPFSVLVNNAGIFGKPFALSHDNIELHFAINYVVKSRVKIHLGPICSKPYKDFLRLLKCAGHFLLTELLLDTMKRSAQESNREGRIVYVASVGHRLSYNKGIWFDKINDHLEYNSLRPYGQAKFATILHANKLARRLKTEGAEITANSVHPGIVSSTNIYHPLVILIPNGAATSCYVALNPQVKGVSGECFADCNIAQPSFLAKDAELAKRLWEFSLSITNLK